MGYSAEMTQPLEREPDRILPHGDGRIVAAEGVCGGRPRIRGTRITVTDILNALAAGDTVDGLVEDLSGISREDVLAVLRFAAANLEQGAAAVAA